MNKLLEMLGNLSIGKAVGASLLAGVVYYFMFFNDGASIDIQIADINGQLQQAELKKKDTDATLAQVHEMQEKIGRLSSQYQEISRRLPSILVSMDINKAIDNFGRNSGVKVKSKRPGDNIRREVVEEVPVSIALEGTYTELAQFVYLVSSAERMSRVKDVVVELPPPNDEGTKPGKLKFEGMVVGYKIAPEKPKDENKTENNL